MRLHKFLYFTLLVLTVTSCNPAGEITVSGLADNSPAETSTSLTYPSSFILPINQAFIHTPTYSGSDSYLAIISPALPAGLIFDNLSGAISGTPTQASANTLYTVTVQGGTERSTTTFNLIVDATPPQAVVITDDGESQLSTTALNFSWTASSDAETGVSYYEYSVGSTPGGSNIISPTVTTSTTLSLTGLTLISGESYYLQVKTVNGAGQERINISDGIYIGVINDRVWLGGYYQGDNSYYIEGATYCTTSNCTSQGNPGLTHFTGSPSYQGTGTNTNKIFDTGGSSLLILQSFPTDTQANICSNAGCSVTTLAPPRLLLENSTYYGGGYFCNLLSQSCSQVSSFTPHPYEYNTNRVYQASDGVWASSNTSALYFLNSTTYASQLSVLPWANNLKTDKRVSGIWAVTLSAPNYIIKKCSNDGTCSDSGTVPTAQGTITMEVEAGGLGTWVLSSTGHMRFCNGSTCTLLGSTFGTSAELIKDKDGTGVFFKSGANTKLNYCSPTACSEIFTGGSNINFLTKSNNEQEIHTGISSGAYARSNTNLLYCSTTSCTILKNFVGENFLMSVIYSINNTINKGIWLYAGTAKKTNYCTDTSCLELAGGDLGNGTVNNNGDPMSLITASKYSSNSWIIVSNTLYRCSVLECISMHSLGNPWDVYSSANYWTFFNTR
jgi:hypothetical protein